MIATTSALFNIIVLSIQFSSSHCFLRDYTTFNKNVTATLNNLLGNNRYDKRIRPDIGGPPTVVTVQMHIKSIGPVSEVEQLYTMDVYFRQTWYDTRLKYNLTGLNEFSMSWIFLDKVWKPDTYFTNGKKSYLHKITSPNKFLRLRYDGFLTYSMRLTLSATCKMHLVKFPMDVQRCPLIMGSYGYTTNDVVYQWHPSGVGLEPGMELAQFDLDNVTMKDHLTETRSSMEFSVVKATFILRRNIGYFVLQMYVPCILMVCSSWVNFWIDPDCTPARVQLSVTSVLSITTIGFVGRSALPKVPYPTALDWFVILCFVFVFAVLVEYAVINFIDKVTDDIKKILENRDKKKKEKEEKEKQEKEDATSQEIEVQAADGSANIATDVDKKVGGVDFFERHADLQSIDRKDSSSISDKFPSFAVPTIIVQTETVASELGQHQQCIIEQGNIEIIMGGNRHLEDDDLSREMQPSSPRLRRTLTIPVRIWREFKFLPTEQEVSESKGEKKEKFTKIDKRSRFIFPALFTIVLSIYVLLYTYVIVDNKLYKEDD
ncbi:gamma-aminobutyric acid receptor subunit alpha-6 [Nilaparvata lugens]|uniref:gamma-aminobutyric acid receptor subunit alpha-6 n=1 Tax=Nilaparvata lugens TaxID=108931 RepID=UPI00193E127B|nr:gamma-aminobutyric acid receptor subunit alpha-6 [Nilaparvata lugens]XP_039279531.1 gamma-aminobutyric acid receptor subunit alpha-6 [Nilaparvata lugens]